MSKLINEEHEGKEEHDCVSLEVNPKLRKHWKSLTTYVSFQDSDDQSHLSNSQLCSPIQVPF